MSGLGGLARYFDDVMRTIRRPDLDEIRVQRILEDMPYTADIYSPEALGRAVSSGVQLRGITPDQFTELAYPLELTGTAKNLVEHYADLLRNKRWTEPTPGILRKGTLTNNAPSRFWASMTYRSSRYAQNQTNGESPATRVGIGIWRYESCMAPILRSLLGF